MRYLFLFAVCFVVACKSGNRPVEQPVDSTATVTTPANPDSLSILSESGNQYQQLVDDGKKQLLFVFSDTARLFADSACTAVLGLVARHSPISIRPDYEVIYALEQYSVPVTIADGKTGFMLSTDLGLGNTWQASGKSYFSIVAYPDVNDRGSAMLQIYEGGNLKQQQAILASHGPIPVGPITELQGKQLPQPLYAVFSISEECGTPEVANLFYYADERFHFLARRLRAGDAGMFGTVPYENLGNDKSITLLQHTYEVNDQTEQEDGSYAQDTTYLSERTTYAWKGNRFVRTDSMPAVTEIKWK